MKRIIFCLSVMISFFIIGNVKAETFTEGAWINGEYISKVKDGRTYFLTAQFIQDNQGEAIYCLEPFVDFQSGSDYVKYEDGFERYLNLTTEQVRRIKLIGYYGYGFDYRVDSKWYVITQYMIWKVIDPNADIYFTDKLNGKRIDKYAGEIAELENDVNKAMLNVNLNNSYDVTYKDGLLLNDSNGVLDNFLVESSDFEYNRNGNSLEIKNVLNDGKIVFKQTFTNRTNAPAIYLHASSQKLLRVGRPDELRKEVNIKVISGSIEMDIKEDDSVYTVESDFNNVCYGIYDKDNNEVNKVCTDKELKYKMDSLVMGDYFIKQLSVGTGYRKDERTYKVTITKDNPDQVIELKNALIRNDVVIDKSYCKNEECLVESDAKFEVYDKNDNKVKELVTDSDGIADVELGYGSYKFKQVEGKEGYSFVDDFMTRIVNETDKLLYALKNNYIETKVASVSEVVNEEMPPDTRTGSFVKIGQILRNICYIFGQKWGKC